MFTGIIEELGSVKSMSKEGPSGKIVIAATHVNQDLAIGDSVAVNGVCLTVTEYTNQYFTAEVMRETLDSTLLGLLKPGEKVNLERALRPDSRMGGHMVTGHVDATGRILSKKSEGIAWIFDISYPEHLAKYIAPKGSIAVDGISLTVVSADNDVLRLSLIPHSISMTTLGHKKEQDLVNLEIDILARYIERLLDKKNQQKDKTDLSESFLAEHGFI